MELRSKIKGENERLLYEILNDAYPGQWVCEHRGIEGRKFRFDCANVKERIAIEVEGGLWITGRHNRPVGMMQDMEKYNAAVIAGWRVLRYTPEDIKKTPWKITGDIIKLCGGHPNQKILDLSGYKQATLTQVQVKLS